jgi:hypothetical protein
MGLTFCVPPVGPMLYELPSVPVILTWVEFVAVTVSMDELPAAMEAGEAERVTIGAVVEPVKLVPEQPAMSKKSKAPGNARKTVIGPGQEARNLIMVSPHAPVVGGMFVRLLPRAAISDAQF